MATQKNITPDLPKARRDIKPNKGGRPKKAEDEKKKAISAYFTDDERAKIIEDAKGRPLSVFVHHQTVYGKVVMRYQRILAMP